MLTPRDDIIWYDGRTLAVTNRAQVQIEARRGRRWRWCGRKGWWVHLYLFRGWHVKKFVSTLAEAGVFLKYDPDELPWLESERQPPKRSEPAQPAPSPSSRWNSVPFSLF